MTRIRLTSVTALLCTAALTVVAAGVSPAAAGLLSGALEWQVARSERAATFGDLRLSRAVQPIALERFGSLRFELEGRGALLAAPGVERGAALARSDAAAELVATAATAALDVFVLPRARLTLRFSAEQVSFDVDALQAELPVAELVGGTEAGLMLVPEASVTFELSPRATLVAVRGLGRDADAYGYTVELDLLRW